MKAQSPAATAERPHLNTAFEPSSILPEPPKSLRSIWPRFKGEGHQDYTNGPVSDGWREYNFRIADDNLSGRNGFYKHPNINMLTFGFLPSDPTNKCHVIIDDIRLVEIAN